MDSALYHCVCYTCAHEQVRESFATAEAFYDYHAGQDHDVELVRLHSDWPREGSP